MSAGTSTLPSAHTRPRSLRTRSTIMRFSARDFSSARSAAARYASSKGWATLAAVPLMGLDSTMRSRLTRAKGAVAGERIDRAVAVQLGGQADLVTLTLEDLVQAGGDVGEVGVAI